VAARQISAERQKCRGSVQVRRKRGRVKGPAAGQTLTTLGTLTAGIGLIGGTAAFPFLSSAEIRSAAQVGEVCGGNKWLGKGEAATAPTKGPRIPRAGGDNCGQGGLRGLWTACKLDQNRSFGPRSK
jgi:hypothetical protein